MVQQDIAIVGMACMFPGAANLRQFWENILAKHCALGDPPAEWEAECYRSVLAEGNDQTYCTKGGYLGDLARFDPLEFGVMPNSLDGGEPDHYLTLRVANDALRDAGCSQENVDPQRTEVIVGRGTYINRGVTSLFQHAVVLNQTIDIVRQLRPDLSDEELARIHGQLKQQLPPFNVDTTAAMIPNVLAGRIANRLNLMGVNYIVDAACASSLVAVELGMSDLRAGKCDMAIVGGVNASLPPPTLMIFSQLKALSRNETLRAFDQDADGTMLGEGLGVVVLKRRDDARRDGNRVYAVLKSVGLASDGRAQGLLAPRREGQALAIARAYESAGLSPDSIELVEAHGTGVRLGDATEVQSLTQVFGPRNGEQARCGLGTVKTSIGHLLTAAGMAGLIKTSLALYHKVLPPMIGCDRPNTQLQLETTPFYINSESRPWIHGETHYPRRAGVNAFGFGGINAHAIVEEATDQADDARGNLHRHFDAELILLDAPTRSALLHQVERLAAALADSEEVDLANLSYTLCRQQSEGRSRLALVARDIDDLRRKLDFALRRLQDSACRRIREKNGVYYSDEPLGPTGKVAFLFPGEGSQYPNMLADLCLHFPWFRQGFDLVDRAFVSLGRSYLPSQAIFPLPLDQAGRRDLWAMDTAAEAVFAGSQALLALVRRLAIRPDVLVGHSTGEYSALLASGSLEFPSPEQYIDFILGVNRVFEELSREQALAEGVLLSVGGASREAIDQLVTASGGRLHLAMDNCPTQFILFGRDPQMEQAEAALRDQGAICMRLPFGRAYHTPLFSPLSDRLRHHLRSADISTPKIELVSCATAAPFPQDPEGIRELLASQWSRTVRFTDTIRALYERGVRVFVEVGPRANLTSFVENTLRGKPILAVASNVHFRSGIAQLQNMLGLLYAHHVPFDPGVLFAHREVSECLPFEPTLVDDKASRYVKIQTVLPRVRLGELPPRSGNGHSQFRGHAPGPSPAVSPVQAALPESFSIATSPVAPPEFATRSGSGAHAPHASAPVVTAPPDGAATAAQNLPMAGQAYGIPAPAYVPPQQTATSTGHSPGKSAVMLAYLQTMREYVASQQDVCQDFFARRGQTRPTGDIAPQAIAAPGTHPGPTTSSPAKLPFVSHVSEHEPGQRAVVRCHLDLNQERFLLDHTLGGKISQADPALGALAVVPLTFTMEILAEAASLLAPDKVLVGMREVSARRWIGLDEGQRTLEIHVDVLAQAGAEIAVRARVSDVTTPGLSAESLVESTCVFADRFPQRPAVAPFSLKSERPSRWAGRELYGDFMFHGPSLQGVASIDRWGEDGCLAILRALPDEPLFAASTRQPFLADPVVLDAAGQVVGYWTSDHLTAAYHVFPYRVEMVEFFGPRSLSPRQVRCQARIAHHGDSLLRSDIDLIDDQGRLQCRVLGWWDRRFPMPEELSTALADPRRSLLSARCRVPGDEGAGIELAVFDTVSREFLQAHDAIWERVLARLVLSRSERAVWRSLPEQKRSDWLAGRVAAKDAVRALLARRGLGPLYPADVEIVSGGGSPPTVHVAGLDPRVCPRISLTHTAGCGAAVAVDAQDNILIGIDAEHVRPLDEGFASAAFSAHDQACLAGVSVADRPAALVRAWCAKEAMAKALGLVGSERLHDIVIAQIDPAGPGAVLRLPGPLGPGSGPSATVAMLVRGGLLVALAALRAAPGPLGTHPQTSTFA